MNSILKLFYVVIVFLVLDLYAFHSVLFAPGMIGGGWDWAVYVDSKEFIDRSLQALYTWTSVGLGNLSSASLTSQLLYRLIVLPFYPLAGQSFNKMIFVLYPVIAGCSTFYLARKHMGLSYSLAFLAGTIYMFSPWTYSRLVAGHQCWYFSSSFFPLLIACFLNINFNIEKNNVFKCVVVTGVVFSLVLTGGAHMWINCAIIFLYFLFMGALRCHNMLLVCKTYLYVVIVTVLLCSHWIYSLLLDFRTKKFNLQSLTPGDIIHQRSAMLDSLSPSLASVFTMDIDPGMGKEFVYFFPRIIETTVPFVFIFLLSIAFYAFLKNLKKHNALSQLGWLGIVGLLLLVGTNSLVGSLFYGSLKNISYLAFAAIANPFRLFLIFWLPFSLLVPCGLYIITDKLSSKKVTGVFLSTGVIAIFLLCSPFFIEGIYNKEKFSMTNPFTLRVLQSSKNDKKVLEFLREDNNYYRCSVIPSQYTFYSDVESILHWRLFYRPVFPANNYGYLNWNTYKAMLDASSEIFTHQINIASVKYLILLNKEFNTYSFSTERYIRAEYGFDAINNIDNNVSKFIGNLSDFKQKFSYNGCTIYKNEQFIPPIHAKKNVVIYSGVEVSPDIQNINRAHNTTYISNSDIDVNMLRKICQMSEDNSGKIKFTRTNPTRFMVEISGCKEGTLLVLNEKFNKKWTAYIQPSEFSKDSFNNFYKYFNLPFYLKGKLYSFNKLPSHYKVNGYANAWYIPPQKNKCNIVITFAPQKYYEAFFFFSMLLLVIFVIYILFVHFTK